MPIQLTEVEARVLGCLIEKSMTTPELYPLTLNSLTNACNQKSSRDPVMSLDEGTVARAFSTLQQKGLVFQKSESGNRVPKFGHRVENLLNGGNAKEVGAICVLLLRGPQTPGEIKTRTDRLCQFESTADVEVVLNELAARTDGPFVARLPRQSGQKEARFMHLFSGEAPATGPAPAPAAAKPVPAPPSHAPAADQRLAALEDRVAKLEALVESLRPKESVGE
jgi:uncharacterized protein YceH (UPF0502 family)